MDVNVNVNASVCVVAAILGVPKVPSADVQTTMVGSVYPGFNDTNVPTYWNQGQTRFVYPCVALLDK